MLRRLVVSYQRFDITHLSHIQVLSSPRKLVEVLDEYESNMLYRNVGNYQPLLRNISEERRSHYTAGETRNHA